MNGAQRALVLVGVWTIWVPLALVLCLAAAFVWPTRYRYDHLKLGAATFPVRIDRFTGKGEVFNGTWQAREP